MRGQGEAGAKGLNVPPENVADNKSAGPCIGRLDADAGMLPVGSRLGPARDHTQAALPGKLAAHPHRNCNPRWKDSQRLEVVRNMIAPASRS